MELLCTVWIVVVQMDEDRIIKLLLKVTKYFCCAITVNISVHQLSKSRQVFNVPELPNVNQASSI